MKPQFPDVHEYYNHTRLPLGNAQASARQYQALQAGAWKYGLLLAKKDFP